MMILNLVLDRSYTESHSQYLSALEEFVALICKPKGNMIRLLFGLFALASIASALFFSGKYSVLADFIAFFQYIVVR